MAQTQKKRRLWAATHRRLKETMLSNPTTDGPDRQLPDPIVSPDLDLRAFGKWMAVDVARVRRSDLVLTASTAGIGAAFLLWCAAWHEVPAGSLPNDDRALARLAMMDRADLRKLRDEALHGFIECADGRLYHPVICEKALETWELKQRNDRRTAAATAASRNRDGKRNGQRHGRRNGSRNGNHNDNDLATTRDSPPTPPTGGAVAVVESATLEDRIIAAFMAKSADKGLTWPPSERDHVDRLVERARHEADPEAWCQRFLETAWRLKQSGKGIWRDRPWMPRTFCGHKAITWVIESMADQEAEIPDAVKRVAERMARGEGAYR